MVQEPGTWAGLKQEASQDLLYFDPAAAVTGADAAKRLVDQLLRAREAIQNEKLDDMVNIAGNFLTSGINLTGIYEQRGERLYTVLQDHINIAREMGEAFVQAGLYYRRTEAENADNLALDELAGFHIPYEPTSPDLSLDTGDTRYDDLPRPMGELQDAGFDGTADDIHVQSAYGLPGELTNYAGRQESISPDTVGLEESTSLGFTTFRGLARDLPGDVANTYNAALAWWRLAGHVKSELEKFDGAIEGIQDKWLGPAADRARTATENYVDSIGPLWNSMFSMSENLHYTSEWLRRTQLSMPQEDFTFRSLSVEQTVLTRYREEWVKHYANGMTNTLAEMPVIEGPIAEPEPPPNSGKGNSSGHGSGDGNGNGNGNGSGNEQTPEQAYDEGYDDGYEQGFEDGSRQGPGEGTGQGQNAGQGRGQGEGTGQGRGEGSSQSRGQGGDQGQGSGRGGDQGQGGHQGGNNPGGGEEAPHVPSYDEAEYGTGGRPAGDTSQEPTEGENGGEPVTGILAPVTGATMPKNPTAADVLGKLTGIPKSLLPDALKNIPITGQNGKPPTLADALSKITGIPVDEMPQELQDTLLEELYSEDSPYGSDSTLFEAVPSGVDRVVPAGDGSGTDPESALSALLGTDTDALPAGDPTGQSQNALDRLINMLTQGIQAFPMSGAGTMPGMAEFAQLLDPAQLQEHLSGMLEPDPTQPAMGGVPGGAGLPAADSGPPALATYPGSESGHSTFPRAALPGPGLELAGYAGTPVGSNPGGTPGMPMMGAPGAGAGAASTPGQNGNHTPAEFLTSRENLDEVFEDTPSKVRPVIEQ
ncbi:hypothetical protein AB0M34_06110 [Nocardia sp. NPDC050193]